MDHIPGTPEYAAYLSRQREIIAADINGLKAAARTRAASSGNLYYIEYNQLMRTEAGQQVGRDVAAYNQQLQMHTEAVNKVRQAAANARQAAAIQASTCADCFTDHPGECY